MKEIKAYIHRNRIADVISALEGSRSWAPAGSGEHKLTAYMSPLEVARSSGDETNPCSR